VRPFDARPVRLALLAFAAVSLILGLWAGLIRIGWALPAGGPDLALAHGPLMVTSVLGVVIGLERAVALGRSWAYGAPMAAGLAGLALVLGLSQAVVVVLYGASSLLLVAIFACLFRRRPEWATGLLAVGALLWLVSNGLWLSGRALVELVPWWAAFMVLTIAGERLELAQVLLPARVRLGLIGASALIVAGLAVSSIQLVPGMQIVGLGFVGLAAWLVRYDVARRTVRRGGLARFSAICLLAGYVWLGVGGLFWLLGPAGFPGVFWYDAMVHALFIGFVFSMIFGHAPTIIPAVTGIAVPFERAFYLHVGLLHGSLVLRMVGDVESWPDGRAWGGLLNAVAILLFAVLTVRAARRSTRPMGRPPAGQAL
jgi:hypothetical protein